MPKSANGKIREDFFSACNTGNIEKIKEIIETHPNFDVNTPEVSKSAQYSQITNL